MYLTGFADEAASSIEGQIRATQELGWRFIESRSVDGTNLHDLSEPAFDRVAGKLDDAGIRVNCFGSAIANWAKAIDAPFDSSLEETKRAIPRMHRLGAKLIRIMSFAVLKGRASDDQEKDRRFERLRRLVAMFRAEGLQAVHENCMNYGGMSSQHSLELVEAVPGLKLVFDTGNPVFTDDHSKPEPRPKQSAFEFYRAVRPHVAYVHVKDGVWNADQRRCDFSYCGDGDGDVVAIVRDLLENGYDGGFSMEPHLSAVYHDSSVKTDAERRYRSYVEYGRRFEAILQAIGREHRRDALTSPSSAG